VIPFCSRDGCAAREDDGDDDDDDDDDDDGCGDGSPKSWGARDDDARASLAGQPRPRTTERRRRGVVQGRGGSVGTDGWRGEG